MYLSYCITIQDLCQVRCISWIVGQKIKNYICFFIRVHKFPNYHFSKTFLHFSLLKCRGSMYDQYSLITINPLTVWLRFLCNQLQEIVFCAKGRGKIQPRKNCANIIDRFHSEEKSHLHRKAPSAQSIITIDCIQVVKIFKEPISEKDWNNVHSNVYALNWSSVMPYFVQLVFTL